MNCARPAASLLKYDLDEELIQRVQWLFVLKSNGGKNGCN